MIFKVNLVYSHDIKFSFLLGVKSAVQIIGIVFKMRYNVPRL
jgi:hypothetical protein